MPFRIQNGQVIPSQYQSNKSKTLNGDFEKAFVESLNKRKESVNLSAHALDRMNARKIALNDEDMAKINKAVDILEEKGAAESLLLYKDTAFIASIKNRTIITAMKSDELNTVTNIDSAINIK